MNAYKFIKLNRTIRSPRIKLMAIWLMHVFRRRYFGVFLDPVLGCNLRCRMCYFSDPEQRKVLHGQFTDDQLRMIADKFFPYALKVQIGCGAEPTIFGLGCSLEKREKNILADIIKQAKENGVPYVSITTNANLLTEKMLKDMVESGLDEITISLHGVKKETYEWLMENASYECFINALESIKSVRSIKPFNVRINYTINEDNLMELADFMDTFGHYHIDILQLRPIQNIGKSKYQNYGWQKIVENYDATIGRLKREATAKGITVICPEKDDLTKEENNESIVFDYTYINISPREVFENDFSLENDTYHTYCHRHHFASKLLKRILFDKLSSTRKTKLNYDIC